MTGPEFHLVHDGSGRILAMVDAAETAGPDGRRLRHEPVARPGQQVVRLVLSDEHLAAGPAALFSEFEVDLTASPTTLRRRTAP
ncbi:MAG: hypothetical protein ACLQOZ_14805 [Acidimicrobiales bacterium]|jgi:hypothetical protein